MQYPPPEIFSAFGDVTLTVQFIGTPGGGAGRTVELRQTTFGPRKSKPGVVP